MSTVSGGLRRGGIFKTLSADPETFGLTALLALTFGYTGYHFGKKSAGGNVNAKAAAMPGRASATVSDVVQTKANPTNSTAAAGKRPDEGGHALSDELSKRADEGTLTKK